MDVVNMKFPLTPLDHLQGRYHFPKLLYFASREENPKVIIGNFLSGLKKTLEALPVYAGTLCLDRTASKPGTLVVQEPYWSAEHVLQTVDLRSEYDFVVLESKGFPPDGVDLSLVWPQADDIPTPVLKAQLSLIRNGAILYVGLHHCVSGMVLLEIPGFRFFIHSTPGRKVNHYLIEDILTRLAKRKMRSGW